MVYPVSVDENGLKLRPELMEKERLYHCMFGAKAMLLFKDSMDVLNCYEIEEAGLVEKIRTCKDDSELEDLFAEYVRGLGKRSGRS
ncbi:MAG: hypothetical protein D9C04_00225 [Nitrosopumilus sp. B06]|nr:MAG: hypothetical protein EB828_05340 [Nitrosopumilus sp. D6]RNJ80714.1 MAG: hypothetical protein D9C04_00225 [Nitrosopumilus sp. B06]